MAQCWLNSRGGERIERGNLGPDIVELVAASKVALAGDVGWHSLLSQRDFRRECRMSFHLENLGICTGCAEYVCGACRERHTRCSGEVVG
ncbi:MAG TPA: hypothetical protein VKL40_11800 [Candidatus Angelobacter sp.]|nr:hypothetical protein [Candidatus Angelobacter sp.]